MEKTIEGKIISKQLGEFGNRQIVYGYVGIEKTNGALSTHPTNYVPHM